MDQYLVIEIYERNVCSVTACNTIDNAIETANHLLEKQVGHANYVAEFNAGEGIDDEWQPATTDRHNAWCNWRGNWDAHIVRC